jgi:ABC-type polysaccharide/polyol phosphate export permease
MLQPLKELLRYRALLGYFVVLDLKARYRGSFLGFLWTLLNPLLLMVVMWIVFSRFARVDEDSYALFLLSALMAWDFFSQSVGRSLTSIVQNRALIQLIYLPKLVFPFSIVGSNLLNLLFFFVAYLILASFSEHGVPWTAVLLPAVMLMMLILSAGAALLMCSLTVFFRDFTHLTPVLMRALFYLTPIFYRPDMLGPKGEFFLRLSPVFYPVVATRDVLYYGRVPAMDIWTAGYGTALLLLAVGLFVFTQTERRFVYYA